MSTMTSYTLRFWHGPLQQRFDPPGPMC